jgi:ubiquinone biosynthesis protein
VPRVDWRRTGRRVATFERVSGLPLTDLDLLAAAGLEPDRILERAAVVFFNQIFRDGFFHADMHPGNMLVDPADGAIVALDFGIMGRLSLERRRQLAELLLGLPHRRLRPRLRHLLPRRLPSAAPGPRRLPPSLPRPGRADSGPAAGPDLDAAACSASSWTMAQEFEMRQQRSWSSIQKTTSWPRGLGRRLNPAVNIWQLASRWWRTGLPGEPRPVPARLRDGLADAAERPGRLPEVVPALEARLRDDRPERARGDRGSRLGPCVARPRRAGPRAGARACPGALKFHCLT